MRTPLAHVLIIAAAMISTSCMTIKALPEGPFKVLVTERTGRVLIVRDELYVVATDGAELRVGDRIATLAKASATLQYVAIAPSGEDTDISCELVVPAESVLIVSSGADCISPNIATRVLTAAEADDSSS